MGWRAKARCRHFNGGAAEPRGGTCEECGSAVALRACTECGHVGCCESQLAHNTAHFRATGHPIIRSLPLNDDAFTWCHACKAYI